MPTHDTLAMGDLDTQRADLTEQQNEALARIAELDTQRRELGRKAQELSEARAKIKADIVEMLGEAVEKGEPVWLSGEASTYSLSGKIKNCVDHEDQFVVLALPFACYDIVGARFDAPGFSFLVRQAGIEYHDGFEGYYLRVTDTSPSFSDPAADASSEDNEAGMP